MILGKQNSLKYSLNVGSITNKESDEVEVLEMTIDKVLNLKKYIENLLHCLVQASCFKTNQKITQRIR